MGPDVHGSRCTRSAGAVYRVAPTVVHRVLASTTPTSSRSRRRQATRTSSDTTMTTGEVGERRVFYRPDRLRRRRGHDRRPLRLLREGKRQSPSAPTTPSAAAADDGRRRSSSSPPTTAASRSPSAASTATWAMSSRSSAATAGWRGWARATPLARSPTWATASPTSRSCAPSASASRPPTRSRASCAAATYVTQRRGGDRAVAEACFYLLVEQPRPDRVGRDRVIDASGRRRPQPAPRRARRAVQRAGRAPRSAIGVVSLNVVDAAVELAQEHDVSLMLIASRRQIDAAEFGGGYVEGLTPHTLAERVRARDHAQPRGGLPRPRRPLAGPNNSSDDRPSRRWRRRATSFFADLDAGFDLLHIDTMRLSVADRSRRPRAAAAGALRGLLGAGRRRRPRDRLRGRRRGAEQRHRGARPAAQAARALAERRESQGAPAPLFVVVQTGTKVMERRNVGSLSAPYRIDEQMPSQIHLPQLMAMINAYGTHLRQHNTDYLPDEILQLAPAARDPRGEHRARVRRRGDAGPAVGHGGTRRERPRRALPRARLRHPQVGEVGARGLRRDRPRPGDLGRPLRLLRTRVPARSARTCCNGCT